MKENDTIQVYHNGFLHEYKKSDISIIVEGKSDFCIIGNYEEGVFGSLYDYGLYVYSKHGYELGSFTIHKLKQLDPQKFRLKTKKVFFQNKKTAEKYAQQINEKIQNDEITKL